jgi:hypothetical protein
MKYLIYEATLYPYDVYAFNPIVDHSVMHEKMSRGRPLVSAGKLRLGETVTCIPGSTTLGVKYSSERAEADEQIFNMLSRL